MRKNNGRRLGLRPRLVTGVTVGFMIVSTLVSSLSIVENSRIIGKIENVNSENVKAQIVVEEGKYYTDAVKWAVKVGVASGKSSDSFKTNDFTQKQNKDEYNSNPD